MSADEGLQEPLNLSPREPIVDDDNRAFFDWAARVATAGVLVAVAAWWSSTGNWAGRSYCEVHHEEFCDGFGFESLVPVVLWAITVVVTFLVTLLAVFTRPHGARQRLTWALTIGASVFVANRNNLLWAAVFTGVALYAIASATDP